MIIVEKDYIELDNFVSEEIQDRVEKLLTHPSFPWAFVFDSVSGYTGEDGQSGACGFFHNLMFNGIKRSADLPVIMPIAHAFEHAVKGIIKVKDYNRIRIGLFTKHPDPEPHNPHTDRTDPHWTAVYYVNHCDGDFVLYNETYEDLTEAQAQAQVHQLTIKKRVVPKKGKIVIFNGKHYHASSFPTKTPLRIAITFNFTVE